MSSPTKPANLPDLIWLEIFKFLEYDDLLILKKICGELKDLLSLCVQSKTVVINQDKEEYDRSRFSSKYLVGKSLIGFRMRSDMHPDIKKLVLHNPFALFSLTSFDNLTELRIESTASFNRPNRITIRLKNLESFTVNINCSEVSIVLDAPKLSVLFYCSNIDRLEITHPGSIKRANSWRIGPIVKQMVNLQSLEVYYFKSSEAGSLFDDLKRLKNFHFHKREDDLNVTNERLRSALQSNPNLRIFYKRIDTNSNHALQDAQLDRASNHSLDDQNLAVYQKYTNAINERLNHDELQIRDFQRLSVEFVRKLTGLKSLHVLGAIVDGEKWIELLKRPDFARLTIKSTLQEGQLNLIPEHCPFASFAKIASFQRGDWVLRLKFLEEFRTDVLFDFELLKKMIQQLHYLKLIRAKSYKIKIEDAVVECISNGDVVFREPKSVFLQTIELVNGWDMLFNSEFN